MLKTLLLRQPWQCIVIRALQVTHTVALQQVADGLFVSGEAVARDRSILQQHNISHVVNCVGALYPEYFKADGIQYKTLWLQGAAAVAAWKSSCQQCIMLNQHSAHSSPCCSAHTGGRAPRPPLWPVCLHFSCGSASLLHISPWTSERVCRMMAVCCLLLLSAIADHPQEDITCVLYDTFDFIEAARKGSTSTGATSRQPQQQHSGGRVPPLALQQPPQQRFLQQQQSQQQQSVGRVLVHCSQGVSRSTTIAIAYLMWRTGGSYDEVYQAVRALRGVTSPNVGFMCQLMNWAVRMHLTLIPPGSQLAMLK